jgi:hypothetical protein
MATVHGPTKLGVLLGGIKLHETYLSHLKEFEKSLS